MQIDWFTLVAQVVNFLILLFLLKRFLYGPIIEAMDRREQTIKGRLADAEKAGTEAEKERDSLEAERDELRKHKDELMAQAVAEASTHKSGLIDEARRDAEVMREQWKAAVEREKDAFLLDLKKRTGEEICKAVRRALREMAGDDLEQRVVATFIKRLKAMDEEEEEALAASIEAAKNKLTLESAFPLPDKARDRIQAAITEATSLEVELACEQDEGLVCGIVLRADGSRLSWNLEDYLRDIEEEVTSLIDAGIKTGERKTAKKKQRGKESKSKSKGGPG